MGKVGSDGGRLAEPTLVLSKDSKCIGVADNEVGDDAVGAVITLQHREPQLWGPKKMPCMRHLFCELSPP